VNRRSCDEIFEIRSDSINIAGFVKCFWQTAASPVTVGALPDMVLEEKK
jgi:hypothetical protein